VLGRLRRVRRFVTYGMNVVVVRCESLKAVFFRNLFAPLASPMHASLLYALTGVRVLFAVAWLMFAGTGPSGSNSILSVR
jgi:hypothetical protein